MEIIKLGDHHQSVIDNYLQFTRYQRQQYLKSVETSFQDVFDTRLLEETYTKDEVIEIVANLKDIIYVDLETELVNFSHTNVLLLNQLFSQAEKWHLQMNADLSEIQNRELLEGIQNMEKGTMKLDRPKLTPIVTETEHPNELLRLEVLKLQQENLNLIDEVKGSQEKVSKLTEDYERLNSNYEVMRDKISELTAALETQRSQNVVMEKELKNREKTNNAIVESEKSANENYDERLKEQINDELERMKSQIVATEAQLTLAEQELEKKFNKTAAYENMKKIITKKNEQIKELRKQLTKYESLPEEISDNNEL